MPGGQLTNWKIIIPQKFPHKNESSKPHVRLPSLRVWQQEEEEHAENVVLTANGVLSQQFHRETEMPLLEGKHRVSCTPEAREKSSDLLKAWARLTC